MNRTRTNLGLAIILNMMMTMAEAVGGIVSGSIALVSDAAHNFSDVISLMIQLDRKQAVEKRSYPHKDLWLPPFGDYGGIHNSANPDHNLGNHNR
jgi:hypothetical protein